MPKKQQYEDSEEIDFSFSDIDTEIDKLLKGKEQQKKEKIEIGHTVNEKIKTGLEIRNNLPDEGFLEVKADEVNLTHENKYGEMVTEKKVRITHTDTKGKEHIEFVEGLFKIDLRNDAHWWFIRTPEVVPSMIKQAVRTHLDIKKCYEVEKRKLDIPWFLIIGLIIGALIILLMFMRLASG